MQASSLRTKDLDQNGELNKIIETTVGRVMFNEVVPRKTWLYK